MPLTQTMFLHAWGNHSLTSLCLEDRAEAYHLAPWDSSQSLCLLGIGVTSDGAAGTLGRVMSHWWDVSSTLTASQMVYRTIITCLRGFLSPVSFIMCRLQNYCMPRVNTILQMRKQRPWFSSNHYSFSKLGLTPAPGLSGPLVQYVFSLSKSLQTLDSV